MQILVKQQSTKGRNTEIFFSFVFSYFCSMQYHFGYTLATTTVAKLYPGYHLARKVVAKSYPGYDLAYHFRSQIIP